MEGSFLLLFLVFWPIVGGVLCYLIGRRSKTARNYCSDLIMISDFVILVVLFAKVLGHQEFSFHLSGFCGFGLNLQLDGFRVIYGTIAALMWMMTSIFSKEYFTHYRNRNRYYLFYLMTFGATLGVFLSADLYTAFVFFEVMSMTSYVMVIHDEKPAAMRAGDTYLAVAVIGGLVMLMGIFLLNSLAGTLMISELVEACRAVENRAMLYVAGALILFGYGAKAGMFPLHIWLPKAHPVAPAPASALLSGVLTKAGVFGVLVVSANMFLHDEKWAMAILLIGVVTMFLGAFLALFSIDLKRTLACSSMSQIGFILTGTAMQGFLGSHNALAVRGTLLHMVNHSLIKLVLFMAAGVIYMNLHKLNLNDIRGFGRGKPLLLFCFLMGYLGIIGMPLWNGYISKTLIHESIVEYIWMFTDYVPMARFFQVVESVFTLSGGLTAAYMTKLLVAVFFEKNPTNQEKMDSYNKKYMKPQSCFALLGSAIILPVLGFFPGRFMDGIASLGQEFMHGHDPDHAVHYFVWANLRGAVVSLAIGALVYLLVVRPSLMRTDEKGNRVYVDLWPSWLDLENLVYRPVLNGLAWIATFVCRIIDRLLNPSVLVWVGTLLARVMDNLISPRLLARAGTLAVKPLDDPKSLYPKHGDPRRPTNAITRSLSFSLLLFGVGACIILVCLIIATR